jgi:hypothetical protein
LDAVPQTSITEFAGTTNEPEINKDSPAKSERAHYFDGGVTQKLPKASPSASTAFTKARTRFSIKGSSVKH